MVRQVLWFLPLPLGLVLSCLCYRARREGRGRWWQQAHPTSSLLSHPYGSHTAFSPSLPPSPLSSSHFSPYYYDWGQEGFCEGVREKEREPRANLPPYVINLYPTDPPPAYESPPDYQSCIDRGLNKY